MPECGHLIGGDPARPCADAAGHRSRNHRDAAERERIREYNREHYERNRERIRERNRERNREYSREYRERNREYNREYKREHYERNRERIREYKREYAKNPAVRRAHHEYQVRRKYGLEPHEYAAIKKAQGGKCAICQRATGRTKRLAVDHCHKTRAVRGLLCSPCNHALGHLRDDPAAFQRAIDYLANPPAPQALGKCVLVACDSPAQQPRKRKPRATRKAA